MIKEDLIEGVVVIEDKKEVVIKDPYEGINFTKRKAEIYNSKGEIIFDEDVDFPDYFDDAGVKIVSSKYLCNDAKKRETSVKEMVDRVSDTIADWGKTDGYFQTDQEYEDFKYNLKYYQIHQYFTFNSPVYFNVGLSANPQGSACFILSVDDDMADIYENIKLESAIFKNGSGSGSNLSSLRSSKEKVRGGGLACLTGDTILINDHNLNKCGIDKGQISISEQYNRMIKGGKYNLPRNIRCMIDDGLLGVNKIEDIVKNGIRFVFMIETEHGYKIKATANHRFLSEYDGWRQLDAFSKGDNIAINGRKRTFGECKRCGKEKSLFGKYSEFFGYCDDCKRALRAGRGEIGFNLPKMGTCKRCGKERMLRGFNSKHCGYCNSCAGNQYRSLTGSDEHKETIKKRGKKISETFKAKGYREYYRKINLGSNNPQWKGDNASPSHARTRWVYLYPELKKATECERCGASENGIEIHHRDGNVYNNERDNLEVLCFKCHHDEHIKRRGKYIPHKQKEITFDKIIKIEFVGEEEVYDIQMKEPFHNFIANGFVSHNSGPISFLKAADTSAGVIRSGGTLRRSAKLSCLNDTHPDIKDFIHCKEREEKKLRILKNAGLEPEAGHDMSDEVFFQNTNISVRLSDDFMKAVEQDNNWWTKYILTGEKCEKFKAHELLEEISDLAWKTADPGVQFSDNINKWNTCTKSGTIEASNPCSEYMFLNSSPCNLAAVNLRKFFYKNKQGKIIFDLEEYQNVIKMIITAQDIIVSNSSYPSRKITKNAHVFRPLGLGYSNIGSLLMWLGISYDSNDGRTIASLITALLTGMAYKQSKDIAKIKGSFERFEENKESFYKVLKQHYSYKQKLKDSVNSSLSDNKSLMDQILKGVISIWTDIISSIDNNEGFRNAQLTLLAPTGTTSFMMGCDTFGIEPDYSLVKYKTLSGSDGAVIKTVNNTVKESLENLEYSEYDIGRIVEELHSVGHLENNDILKKEHLPIFDTATIPAGGTRCINYMAHIKMLEAVQPFLSGAISKTVNLPSDVTVDDIYNLYLEAWKRGLKGITVYRDGSKEYQPLRSEKETKATLNKKCENCVPFKMKMPENRDAEIHKFSIGNTEGYIILGKYPSGKLGEVFLTVSKQGSTLSGFLDSLGIMISTSLQYGVPLKVIVSKLMFSKFEPSGITKNKDIRFTTSMVDYLAKYLGYRFLSDEDKLELGLIKQIESKEEIKIIETENTSDSTSIVCEVCGSLMVRVGTCYNCSNCGTNSGACG